MNRCYNHRDLLMRITGAAVFLLLLWAQDAQAQWSTKWLAVGRLHYPYLSGGAEPENLVPQSNYPGIQPAVEYNHWKGLWISARNFTDENNTSWDIRTSHIGPRDLGLGEFFSIEFEMVSRLEVPLVTVDGAETFQRPAFVDRIDESQGPDRLVRMVTNSSVGVRTERTAMQWSNEFHDNYHIVEYVFTNTGDVDEDEEIELEGQTLNDVIFTFLDRPKINASAGSWDRSSGGMAWGQHTMNDVVGDGEHDFGLDMRAQFSWLGDTHTQSWNTIGNPMWRNQAEDWYGGIEDDTLGRLAGAFHGTVVLHADPEAHDPGTSLPDDPSQPLTMTYIESDWSDITTGSSHNNVAKMELERRLMENGAGPCEAGCVAANNSDPRTTPSHAWRVEPAGDFDVQPGDPSLGRAGGWGYLYAFGPYDMGPGQEVRIVFAEGVAGLSEHAAYVIGRQYKLTVDDDLQIEYDANGDGIITDVEGWSWDNIFTGDEVMTKNQWALSQRDSLFQMFQRAKAVWEAGGTIPTGPLPPAEFNVRSGTDQIELTWTPHPAGGPTRTGWEIYRAQKNYYGVPLALRVGANGLAVVDSSTVYQKIAELDPGATSYTDSQVERGQSYFYYIVAVGEPNQDPTGNTPTGVALRSNRYYAQTFEPATLRRAPGTLEAVRIVPNPYFLGSDAEVRFDVQDRIAFYGLPGEATIKIYSELGELIKTIEHTDGSGDDFWDLTTTSRQVVVSGIYLAVITDTTTGDQTIQKFIIVR